MNIARTQLWPLLLLSIGLCWVSPSSGVPPVLKGPVRPPEQGDVDRFGKYSPTNPSVSRTNANGAEAVLKDALNLQQTGTNQFHLGQVEFDKQTRVITLPGRIKVRDQIVEYALVHDSGKAYESLLTTQARPMDLHLALLLLGAAPLPVKGAFSQPMEGLDGNLLQIEVSWVTNGVTVRHKLAELITLAEEGSPQPKKQAGLKGWFYNGSAFDEFGFAAQREGSIVALIRDTAALVNNAGGDRDNDHVHMPNEKILPPNEWPVSITIMLPDTKNSNITPQIPPVPKAASPPLIK